MWSSCRRGCVGLGLRPGHCCLLRSCLSRGVCSLPPKTPTPEECALCRNQENVVHPRRDLARVTWGNAHINLCGPVRHAVILGKRRSLPEEWKHERWVWYGG